MKAKQSSLNSLWKKGCEFLSCEFAILGGAMSWVSNANLVAAISNAGGFGVLASGSMPPHLLEQEIQKTKALTNNSFGVNLITMNPELNELMNVVIKEKVSHVVLAGGLPTDESIKKLKSSNIKVIGFAPTLIIAKKLQKIGIDALIIEGHEAGGHIGPVSTSVLAQEILPHITEIPVFVAGGIGRGEAIVSYLQMGASGCQLGTRFVCATESPAHPLFKKIFIRSNARDAVPTIQLDPRFPVIPVRAIVNKATKDFQNFQAEVIKQHESGELNMKDAQLKIEHYWAGALKKAVIDGDIENGSLMAGQSVGMVNAEEPTKDIMIQLIEQAESYLQKQKDAA